MKRSIAIMLFLSLFVVIFTASTLAVVPLEIGGSLYTEVRYTPEDLWDGGAGLMFWSNLETEEAKVNLELIWGEDYGTGSFIMFSDHQKPEMPFEINSVTVTAEGPLLNAFNTNARVIMGDFGIDYSDWIGTLTADHWRNGNLDNGENNSRGIALEDYKIYATNDIVTAPTTVNAFHAWYGSTEEVFYGLNTDTEFFDFDTTLSFMRYNNRPIDTNSDGNAEYGESVDYENGAELNVNGDLADNVIMDFTSVYWSRKQESVDLVSAPFNRLQLDWINNPVGRVEFEAYSFGEDFAPRFYAYDYDDDETSEIESYLDKIGSGVKLSVAVNDDLVNDVVELSVGTDIHTLAHGPIESIVYDENWIRVDKDFGQHETALKLINKIALKYNEGLEYHKYMDYNDILLNARVKSELVNESAYNVNSRVVGKYSNTDESFVLDGNLQGELKEGLFKGIAAYLGVQKDLMNDTDEVKPYAGLDYTTPAGIELSAKYAADGTSAVEFDEFGDIEDKGETLISIKKTIEF
ncbi:MAG: hypothetical protein ACOCQW_00360 [Halanaerobiaceae bacterium]